MTTPNVTMDVRKISERTSVIDINGEVTGFAENALMDAYTQASTGNTNAINIKF